MDTMAFIDSIESGIDLTDRLLIRKLDLADPASTTSIHPELINSCDGPYWEVLNSNYEQLFQIGCKDTSKLLLKFVISSPNCGYQVLKIERKPSSCWKAINGCSYFELSGSGLLAYTQIRTICGYTLRDKWKELLQIRIPFWMQCIPKSRRSWLLNNRRGSIALLNLDGSRTGRWSFTNSEKQEGVPQQRVFIIEYIPRMNRKAKYMIFTAAILPFLQYFH